MKNYKLLSRRCRTVAMLLLCMVSVSLFAQDYDKMSAGTQMFLSERNREVRLPRLNAGRPIAPVNDTLMRFVDPNLEKKEFKRPIAEVETYAGQEMISAFVRVNDNNFGSVVALGAVIQSQFKDGLAAMLLPADKIAEISELSNVTYIEVAEVLQPLNDRQRTVTQAFDAMTNSEAAQALGLTSGYTGKGVILGIIDTGVDFQHIAFKDKNGNNRIVRAYKLSTNSTSLTTYSTASQINGLTYDTNAEDHGTHTSSTAGGSSVIVNGSTVTVTDDHANATYGGMAPEADLVIAGLSSLYTTSIGAAIQNICNYADQVGKPCVISLSLGSHEGPHDGTGTIASIVDQYAGNNHIIVYAASNDGMRAAGFDGADGGMYASGTSSSSKPMLVNVQRNFSNADGNVEMLYPTITAYARTAGVPTSLKFHVVNVNTGAVVYSSSAYTSSTTIDLTGSSGLAAYYRSSSSYSNQYGDAGKIRITRTQDSNNNKYYWQIYAPIMLSTSYADNDGDGVYNSNYAFCVSVYPTNTNSSTIIDMWENTYCWFGTDLTLSSSASNSYNLVQGNDECSISDNACYSKVISVGAYVTKNSITDYNGTTHDFSDEYPNIGDHASFSSWQSAGYGPLGTALPHINAPGARIVAGVNHYHTASVDDYSYWSDDYISDLVVNNTNYPYAAMEGTSMATPCVSGIVAQWLQACVEAGKTPTPDYIKEVMAATWDTDEWTNGTGAGAHGAKTFGTHGKINALKGIQYILGCSGGAKITATPTEVAFGESYVGATSPTKKFNVKGVNLNGPITATLSDANGVFSIDATTVSQSQAAAGKDITVTFTPQAAGNYTATVTLTSTGAESVTVTITGTGKVYVPELITDPEQLTMETKRGVTATKTFSVLGANLTGPVTALLTDPNGAFRIDKTSITQADAEEGCDITVTFTPRDFLDYSATVTLSSAGANSATVTITGKVLEPEIILEPESLAFTAGVSETVSKSILVMGGNLYDDIAVTLTDPSGVFAVDKTSITQAEAEEGINLNVTFVTDYEGDYEGAIVLSSLYCEDITIPLTASVSDGGTASDAYLNIAKYATISDAGWNTTYVNTLYKYTEYEQANVAWLTLPVYGAWSSIYYSPKAQNWIKTNVTNTSNKYAGKTWNSNGELLGSSTYFTSASARVMGYNAWNNYTQETFTFYVTNTTAVKLLGLGQNRASSSYPASLKVYECTKNADGSLTDGTTAVKSYTNSATSGTFVLSATDLDESKIYKVEAATYRSYLCEIAFCTPLPEIVTLRQLVSEGVEKKAYKIKDGNIRPVYVSLDGKKLYCKDDNDYAYPSTAADGEIDYSKDQAYLMNGNWDQSNWICLQLDNGTQWQKAQIDLVGHLLKNVTGRFNDKTNPVLLVNSKKLPEAYSNEVNNYFDGLHNIFITCNMMSTSQQGADGKNYFFVAPKPMEVADITWAMWDGEKFVVPTYVEGKSNLLQFQGGFYIDASELNGYEVTLEENTVYSFTGLIKREQASASRLNATRDSAVSTNYVVYPLSGFSSMGTIENGIVTQVNDLHHGKTVKATRYYDTLGRACSQPHSGVNIIVYEYTDGTHRTVKQLLP